MDEAFWSESRLQVATVFAAIKADDAKSLIACPAPALWAAEGRVLAQPRNDVPWLGLAREAVGKDASNCLMALLGHKDWLAGRCDSEAGLGLLNRQLESECVAKKSLKCLLALGSQSQESSWRAAVKCAPLREDPALRPGRAPDGSAFRGWEEGFAALASQAAAYGPLWSPEAADRAQEALARAFAGDWGSARSWQGPALAIDAAEAVIAQGGLDEKVAMAALRRSCAPALADKVQLKVWEFAKAACDSLGMDASTVPLAMVGAEALAEAGGVPRWNRANLSMALFGDGVDAAWATAALAVDGQGTVVAKAMAAGARGPVPTLRPLAQGRKHPLEPVWGVWSHSTKAGFALPKKAVEAARQQFEILLEKWEGAAQRSTIDGWRRDGAGILAELDSGRVGADFLGGLDCPLVGRDPGLLGRAMSPLAWRLAGSLSAIPEEEFVAVAVAQSALGFDLEDSFEQMALFSRVALSASTRAAAERAVIEAAAGDVGSAPKRGAARI